MNRKSVKTSKFLSLVLRHKPEKIGLILDPMGWANVDELIVKANQAGVHLNTELLQQVVEQNDKQRFSLSDDGLRIRANQGHSIPVELGLEPVEPPELLFHGTAARFLTSIQKQGLLSKGRNHVHLSPDEQTAIKVGKRHGKPVVLVIKVGQMLEDGHRFFLSANGVWLTERVPVVYIIFPDQRIV